MSKLITNFENVTAESTAEEFSVGETPKLNFVVYFGAFLS